MATSLLTRRRFLQRSSLALAGPLVLPGRVWAQTSAPSGRLTLGCIGMGRIMDSLLGTFLGRDDVEVVAVCDVDTTRREHERLRVQQAYTAASGRTYHGVTAYNDFRELLARPEIDAVVIGTPDHWHAYMAIAAVRAGKDVYCEKPLTYSIHEALALTEEVRRHGRVLQTGSQQRSSIEFRVAAELVRNQVLGRIRAVQVTLTDPAVPYDKPAEPMEPGLDWDLWCGPGPLVNYNPYLSPRGVHRHFPEWRRTREFSGGGIANWGAHHIDIAHWALDADQSGPLAVRAPDGWEQATRGAQLVYRDGVELTHVTGRGISFFGSEGELHVNRGKFELALGGKTVRRFWDRQTDSGTSMQREVALAERDYLKDARVRLRRSSSHVQDFLDAVRTRRQPICDVEIGARSVIACHLMNCAYYYGANAAWDPSRHVFTHGGDPRWLRRAEPRTGWEV